MSSYRRFKFDFDDGDTLGEIIPSIPDSPASVNDRTLWSEIGREKALEQSQPDFTFHDTVLTIRLYCHSPFEQLAYLNETVQNTRQRAGRDSISKIVVLILKPQTDWTGWFGKRQFYRDMEFEMKRSDGMLAFSKTFWSKLSESQP